MSSTKALKLFRQSLGCISCVWIDALAAEWRDCASVVSARSANSLSTSSSCKVKLICYFCFKKLLLVLKNVAEILEFCTIVNLGKTEKQGQLSKS